ncbi:glycosyltransferase family 2 protein [Candidatus Saccharibacteria bacterium]|nr:glycosyltransferase family 2 protein [Candidatus Saccharibacteria bacterium]
MITPKVLLIIPAYNEEKSIINTIDIVSKAKLDYIVINDGSTDSTRQILEQNNFRHINLVSNLGIGGAVQTGYKYAYSNGYDIAIQFDADGQHDIKYIDSLIKPIQNKQADLVIGSCFIDKSLKNRRSSKIRRFGIYFLSNFIKLFSGKRVHDPTSGFRAANRDIIARFAHNYPQEYPEPISEFELLRSTNFKIKEVPVKMNKREAGKSSINTRKTIYAAINVCLSIIILSIGRRHHE